MLKWFEVFYENERAATVIEYAFIAAVVSIAGVAAWTSMGGSLQMMFGSVSNDLLNSVNISGG